MAGSHPTEKYVWRVNCECERWTRVTHTFTSFRTVSFRKVIIIMKWMEAFKSNATVNAIRYGVFAWRYHCVKVKWIFLIKSLSNEGTNMPLFLILFVASASKLETDIYGEANAPRTMTANTKYFFRSFFNSKTPNFRNQWMNGQMDLFLLAVYSTLCDVHWTIVNGEWITTEAIKRCFQYTFTNGAQITKNLFFRPLFAPYRQSTTDAPAISMLFQPWHITETAAVYTHVFITWNIRMGYDQRTPFTFNEIGICPHSNNERKCRLYYSGKKRTERAEKKECTTQWQWMSKCKGFLNFVCECGEGSTMCVRCTDECAIFVGHFSFFVRQRCSMSICFYCFGEQ